MVCPMSQSESSAKGMESGSESRMVNGWTRLSNCAARMMYMSTTERRKAQMNSWKVVSSSRARPATRVV